MAKLAAAQAFQDMDAKQVGTVKIAPVETRPMTMIAPFAGRSQALHDAMSGDLGLGFPDPGGVTQNGNARCVWMGRDQAMLIGAVPQADWQNLALISDQSDGWAVVAVSGAGAAEVLARLLPVNVPQIEGAARTTCGHIPVAIVRTAPDGYQIMCFRSMAHSLLRDLSHAAGLLVARQRLP